MFGNDREMKRHCGFVGKRAAVRRGFTLIEAMLAGAILAIGCLGVLGILIAVIQQNDVSQRRTEGMYVAELLLNRLETMDATKQTGSPLSDIKSASASRWFALEQNSTVGNRYTANGDVNGSGDYVGGVCGQNVNSGTITGSYGWRWYDIWHDADEFKRDDSNESICARCIASHVGKAKCPRRLQF